MLGAGCAAFSGGALILHALGWLPMYFLINIVGAPSLILLLLLGVFAYRVHETVFLNRLLHGLWIGLTATLAYDGIRLLLLVTGLIDFDPFRSHPAFGYMITGQPETTTTAIVVGWLYHFWNGIGFGVMYTLIAGRARWWYGLLWALALEIAWLTALPSVVSFKLNPAYIIVSFIGHGAYGLVLGWLSQRTVRE